jgi:hypothetical protein
MAKRRRHRRRSIYDLSWLPGRRSRPKKPDPEEGGVPVEPNKPNTLSGGAAAELEFDD